MGRSRKFECFMGYEALYSTKHKSTMQHSHNLRHELKNITEHKFDKEEHTSIS